MKTHITDAAQSTKTAHATDAAACHSSGQVRRVRISPFLEDSAPVEAYIRGERFLSEPGEVLPTRNALHDVYRLQLAGVPVPLILKAARRPSRGSLLRRLEMAVSLLARDRAGRALRCANALYGDAPLVAMPVAAWTWRSGLDIRRYYLCEELEGAVCVRDLLQGAVPGPQQRPESLPQLLGGLLRRLHDAGYWHRDPAPGNIFMACGGRPADAPGGMRLIDHDALYPLPRMVRGGRVSPAVWRFWSCKRLLRKLSEAECRAFADAYLGQACPPGLMALVLRFRERGRETPAGRLSMLWSAACARRRYHGLL